MAAKIGNIILPILAATDPLLAKLQTTCKAWHKALM